AYVRAYNTTLAAKVSGYVARIAVEDNSYIHAGDVIATLDDGDYQLAVAAARDKLATQQATVDRIGRQITAQQASVAQAKAQLDLSFTVIRAPIDGVVGNRAVQTGDFVQTGQRLASLVPLDEVYVEANFKETQLARLRPGQTVSVSIDALPGRAIEGTVA